MERHSTNGTHRWRPLARRAVAGAGLALMLAAPVAVSAPVAAAGPADGAAKLIERYLEVTGGRAAHEAFRSAITWMTLTIPAQEIELSLTIYHARPNLVYTLLESPLTGRIESGTDGEVAWELSAATGPRLKAGKERTDALRDAAFEPWLHWREIYERAEPAGVDTVDGRLCDRVVLTPTSGRPRTVRFDRETGLMQGMDFVVESPAGDVPVQNVFGDWRRAGELLMLHRTELTAMGQRRVLTVDSVAVNADIPAERFAPPPEVRELMEAER